MSVSLLEMKIHRFRIDLVMGRDLPLISTNRSLVKTLFYFLSITNLKRLKCFFNSTFCNYVANITN